VKKLGPFGTIAKVARERKEKPQKRLEKCGFLPRRSQITCGNAGNARISRFEARSVGGSTRMHYVRMPKPEHSNGEAAAFEYPENWPKM
jgi:hypothetical protein